MQTCVFQHVSFEGLGCIENWLREQHYSICTTRFFAGDAIPNIDAVDFLLILGGPMSVNDEQLFPWLIEEKKFIQEMVEKNKPVLGICLGAQMIAASLGAKVYPHSEKEIGWFPIHATPPAEHNNFFRFPDETYVFHWHGETFDLPLGASRLARSVSCKHPGCGRKPLPGFGPDGSRRRWRRGC